MAESSYVRQIHTVLRVYPYHETAKPESAAPATHAAVTDLRGIHVYDAHLVSLTNVKTNMRNLQVLSTG